MGRMGISWRKVIGCAIVGALMTPACSSRATDPVTTLGPIVTVQPVECEPGSGVDALLVPRCGVLLGTIDAESSGTVRLGVAHQEATVRAIQMETSGSGENTFRFDLLRVYQRGINGAAGELRSRLADLEANPGRLLYLSVKVDRGLGAWANVADGQHDDGLQTFGRAVAEGGHTIFLSLHHEPEGDEEGSHQEYVAMWRHAHGVIEAAINESDGAGDVVWVMNYQGHVGGENLQAVDAYYPGNDYVDWLSYNPYNWAGCHDGADWRSFYDVASPMYRYLTTEPLFLNPDGSPKPILIGETASNEDPDDPNRKAEWIRDLAATLEGGRLPQIKAVVYFNQAAPAFCDRYWDTSEASAAAFAELATDPFFDPQASDPGAE